MNIYLDIDGTLLIGVNQAASGADEFLQQILKKYPDSTYWLTTHCWRGENRAIEVLALALKTETVNMLDKVRPTEWGNAKTDAIDFSKPFLWFDDMLSAEEAAALAEHNALDRHVHVDLYNNPNQLRDLAENLQ